MPMFMVYVIVGLVSAGIDHLTLSILIQFNTAQWLAVTIAFTVGLLFNLKAHAFFTFTSPLTSKFAIRFTLVVAFNYLLTLIMTETLTAFSLSLITAKVVELPIIAVTGYFLGRNWAFKP
jgi:putative flippase GtrA